MRARFGDFVLDSDAMLLQRGGVDVHLSRKAFELLRILLEHRGRVVGKAELQDQLWPDTFVVDANLNVLVAEVRRALADPARAPRLVKTVHGVGYRFCGDVEGLSWDRQPLGARYWLIAGDRRFPLPDGETTIGRDPGCDVWLEAPGVSRVHARIHTTARGDVILEDCGSTNGTYQGGVRIARPIALHDGDAIQIGSLALIFRASGQSRETERVRPPR